MPGAGVLYNSCMDILSIEHIERIAALILKKRADRLSATELAELEGWVKARPQNEQLYHQLMNDEQLRLKLAQMEEYPVEKHVQSVLGKIGHKRPFIWYMKRVAVAASVILIMGIVATVIITNNGSKKALQETTAINPGETGAQLTLEDGSVIDLDSVQKDGLIAIQGDVQIIRKNGRLLYLDKISGSPVVGYNTISTPMGKDYSFSLPDGSKVWLNAGSSIRFPTIFTGEQRRVAVTGEAYFEVVKASQAPGFKGKDKHMPFIVTGPKDEWSVQVLGTQFNINAYAGNNNIKTTLVEGSVQVKGMQKAGVILKPGQQAYLQPGEEIAVSEVDTEDIIAWKNGRFSFQDENLESIMDQVARWYNVKIVYLQKIDERYTVNISKQTPLTDLLQFIEKSGGVSFQVKGTDIIVKTIK